MEGGYIKLYRKIRDHWIWQNAEHLKWWLDLLLLANHHPQKFPVNGILITIDTGEHHTSEKKLAARWFVNRKTVDKFLKMLEKDEMILLKKSRQNGTTIKVLNYKAYQAFFEGDEDNEKDNGVDIERTSKGHKQEPKEPQEPEYKDMSSSEDISPADFRRRYLPEQLKIIDEFFGILKHTRKSARLANSVVMNIYRGWEKHEPQKVVYALHKYIHTTALHDKKENYVMGIIQNTTMAEIEQYKSKITSKPNGSEQSQKQFKTAYERTLDIARQSIEKSKNGECMKIDI